MAPVKLISVEETYHLQDQTARSTVKFSLSDSLKATAFTTQPDGLSGIELEGKKWSIEHHHPTRSTFFKVKADVGDNTKLTISQAVPNNKWFLVPNPAFKLSHKNAIGSSSLIELSYDALHRTSSAVATVYAGEDKDYKAVVGVYSKKGVAAKGRAKLHKGLFHSVSASVSTHHAPQLSVKSKLGGDAKVKTSYDVGTQVLKFEAERKGEKPSSGPRMTTTFHAEVPLEQGFRMNQLKPRVIVGVKAAF